MKLKALKAVREIEEDKEYEAVGVYTHTDGEEYYQIKLDKKRVVLYHTSRFEILEE